MRWVMICGLLALAGCAPNASETRTCRTGMMLETRNGETILTDPAQDGKRINVSAAQAHKICNDR